MSMNKSYITNLGEADVFYMEQGAVGFFDSMFPLEFADSTPRIYQRHYFDIEDREVGVFIPEIAMISHHSIKVAKIRLPWGKHPRLTLISPPRATLAGIEA